MIHGFRTARAVVVDNDPKEAQPVITALSELGIDTLYFTGATDGMTFIKRPGVRLLIVDMVLDGADANDSKQCVSTLIGALEQILLDGNEPLVIICWTQHQSLKDEFETAFRRTFKKYKVADILVLDKTTLVGQAAKLKLAIEAALAKHGPIALLFRWEQMVHDSATKITSELTRLITSYCSGAEDWNECAFKICASLALAERGRRLTNEPEEECVKAFLMALNPLLQDQLEHEFLGTEKLRSEISKPLKRTVTQEKEQWSKGPKSKDKAMKRAELIKLVKEHAEAAIAEEIAVKYPEIERLSDSLLPDVVRAELNSMLHLAPAEVGNITTPGNIYLMDVGSTNCRACDSHLPTLKWDKIMKDTFLGKALDFNHCAPFLLEVSPVCDFAQDKAGVSRLLAGFLVRESEKEKIPSRTAFLFSIGPLYLSKDDFKSGGCFYFVINARYLVAIGVEEVAKFLVFRRLRINALAAISSFVAGHINRPGFMKIEP